MDAPLPRTNRPAQRDEERLLDEPSTWTAVGLHGQ
jgi:hypothetical protein